MKHTKQIMLGLVLIVMASITIAAVTNPQKFGAMYSSDGTGNPGSWVAVSGSGAAYTGSVTPAGIMVSSDGTGNPGSWVAATANTFANGVTSIDTLAGAFTFGGSGVSHVANAYTFSNSPTVTEWQNGPKQAVSVGFGQNVTRLFSFVMPVNMTNVTKISYNVNTTADNTANLYDIGFYSATGTLLCHTGPIAGTTTFPANNASVTLTFLSTGCTLTAGTRYLFGNTTNAAASGTMQSIGLGFMAVA
ncbi:MAG TPA: hypothetical protein VGH83_01170, partial [Candidatus Acidoferrum sp.]